VKARRENKRRSYRAISDINVSAVNEEKKISVLRQKWLSAAKRPEASAGYGHAEKMAIM
jgi:hypothetical protein